MEWMLPLLAALFWFSTYRPSMALPPWWNLRGTMLQQQALLAFAPLVAGVAAWMGSREGRRGTADLVRVTALPRWAGQLATWAATTWWAMVAYLGGVAVVCRIAARQAIWGDPLWVAGGGRRRDGGGVLCPGVRRRGAGSQPVQRATGRGGGVPGAGAGAIAIEHNNTYAQIWPLNVQGALPPDALGSLLPYLPTLPSSRCCSWPGWPPRCWARWACGPPPATRWLRCAAAVAAAAGLAAAGTGVGLAGTARLEANGIVIPALHGGQ